MTTVNEALGGVIESAIKNPKSTLSALLTVALVGIPSLLACQCIHGKTAAIAGALLTAAKLYVGARQLDANHFTLPPDSSAEINVPAGSTLEQTATTKVTP